jgi:hypothetical protein
MTSEMERIASIISDYRANIGRWPRELVVARDIVPLVAREVESARMLPPGPQKVLRFMGIPVEERADLPLRTVIVR